MKWIGFGYSAIRPFLLPAFWLVKQFAMVALWFIIAVLIIGIVLKSLGLSYSSVIKSISAALATLKDFWAGFKLWSGASFETVTNATLPKSEMEKKLSFGFTGLTPAEQKELDTKQKAWYQEKYGARDKAEELRKSQMSPEALQRETEFTRAINKLRIKVRMDFRDMNSQEAKDFENAEYEKLLQLYPEFRRVGE